MIIAFHIICSHFNSQLNIKTSSVSLCMNMRKKKQCYPSRLKATNIWLPVEQWTQTKQLSGDFSGYFSYDKWAGKTIQLPFYMSKKNRRLSLETNMEISCKSLLSVLMLNDTDDNIKPTAATCKNTKFFIYSHYKQSPSKMLEKYIHSSLFADYV